MHKKFFIYVLICVMPLYAMTSGKKYSRQDKFQPDFINSDGFNGRIPGKTDSSSVDLSGSDYEDGQVSCRTYIAHSGSQYSCYEDEDSYSELNLEQPCRPIFKKGGAPRRAEPRGGSIEGSANRNVSRNNSRKSSRGLRNGRTQNGTRTYSRGTGRLNYEKIVRSYPGNETDDDESYTSDEQSEIFYQGQAQSPRPDFKRSQSFQSDKHSHQSFNYTLIADLMRLGRIKGWPVIAGIMIAHNYYPTLTRICVGIAACIGCAYVIKKIKNTQFFEKTEKEVNKYLNILLLKKNYFTRLKMPISRFCQALLKYEVALD